MTEEKVKIFESFTRVYLKVENKSDDRILVEDQRSNK